MSNNLILVKKRSCVPQETEIINVRLANAYVPIQKLCGTFDPFNSLVHGTAFPPLVSDYVPGERRLVLDED